VYSMVKVRIRFHRRPYTEGRRPVARRQIPNNMWFVEKIEISGGFLPGLSVTLPQGLTCIIGARGSGKSTLAEAVRFALCGLSSAPKSCADLIQANLAGGALVTITALADGSNRLHDQKGPQAEPGSSLIRQQGDQ
jgi:hypothetical protein